MAATRIGTLAAVGLALAAGWTLGAMAPFAGITAARAQSVSVLSDAKVGVRDAGRLRGTQLVYVELANGTRCVASDNGAGEVTCSWSGE